MNRVLALLESAPLLWHETCTALPKTDTAWLTFDRYQSFEHVGLRSQARDVLHEAMRDHREYAGCVVPWPMLIEHVGLRLQAPDALYEAMRDHLEIAVKIQDRRWFEMPASVIDGRGLGEPGLLSSEDPESGKGKALFVRADILVRKAELLEVAVDFKGCADKARMTQGWRVSVYLVGRKFRDFTTPSIELQEPPP